MNVLMRITRGTQITERAIISQPAGILSMRKRQNIAGDFGMRTIAAPHEKHHRSALVSQKLNQQIAFFIRAPIHYDAGKGSIFPRHALSSF